MEIKYRTGYESLSLEDKDYNLWLLLIITRRLMYKARQRELNQYGITPPQAGILHVIENIGNKVTPAEISRQTLREPHTVSVLIDSMSKKGLVKKVKDLNKKNLVRVAITEKGKQAYYQSTKRDSVHEIMSSLSEEERQQLNRCLNKLQDKALQVLYPPYPWK